MSETGMSARAAAFVILILYAILALQVFWRPLNLHEGVSRDIGAAVTLHETGIYSDGVVAPGRDVEPGRYSPPAYATLIAALAVLDPALVDGARCYAAKPKACTEPYPFTSVVVAQAVLAALALWIAYLIAFELSGSREIAVITMAIVLIGGKFGEYARLIYPHVPIATLHMLIAYLALIAWRYRSIAAGTLGGIIVGVLVLFETVYLPLIWVLAGGFLLAALLAPAKRTSAVLIGLALLVGAYAVVLPWHLRNRAYFGDTDLAPMQAAWRLGERAAYAKMTARDLAASFVVWLPDIGNGYGSALFGQPTVDRIGTFAPGSYRADGLQIVKNAARDPDVIVSQHLLANPTGYVASLAPIIYRGLWSTGSVFVLWGAFLIPRLLRRLRTTKTLAPFLAAAAPLVAAAVVPAFVSANPAWANMSLLAIYAYAIAHVFGGLEIPLAWRRRA